MYKLLWFVLSLVLDKSLASTLGTASPNNKTLKPLDEADYDINVLGVKEQTNDTDACSQNNQTQNNLHNENGDDYLYKDEEDYSDSSAPEEPAAVERPRAVVIRCSRRFTPGNCQEPVTTVWTYVFELQNCTARLGCIHSSERENRFKSLNRCIRTCHALGTLYSKGLQMDGLEKDSDKPPRPSRLKWFDDKYFPTLPPLHESYSDNEGRPVAREYHHHANQRKASYEEYWSAAADPWGAQSDGSEFGIDAEVLNDFYHNFNE